VFEDYVGDGYRMITSTANTKVKHLVNLRKKRKARDGEHVFLAEGLRMFREVPAAKLKEIYVTETFYKKERGIIRQLLSESGKNGIVLELLSDTVFGYVSDTKTPQGILCVVEQIDHAMEEVTGGTCPHIMVLDHLQDPGNLGTIFRTAEGAGVTGILMDRECVDIYNPKTIRSTMGSVYRMPFCYADDLAGAVRRLQEAGIRIYAAHLKGTRDYDEEDYGKPCAFLIGNEGNGLTPEIAELADTYIKIPMKGKVESLNAAIAASVLMFEAARQRRRM